MKLYIALATGKWKRKSCLESDVKQKYQKEGKGYKNPFKAWRRSSKNIVKKN